MKKLLYVIVGILLVIIACAARDVTATWDQPDEQPEITWNIFRRAEPCSGSGPFTKINTSPVLQKTYVDPGVPFGTLSYQVTAQIDDNGNILESPPSNCAEITVTPSSPNNLQLALSLGSSASVTNCAALASKIWMDNGQRQEPLGVSASDTQLGDACAPFVAFLPQRN